MRSLSLHPDCSPCPVTAVEVEIVATSHGCRARFHLRGDIAAIKVPGKAIGVREDFLWKTTCCEIFWQPVGGRYYREFNLSPSGKWAAYDFGDFRELIGDSPVPAIAVACAHTDTELELVADIASQLSVPADIALNAIIEDRHGTLYNWALAFQPGAYEFHSEACRQVHIEERP